MAEHHPPQVEKSFAVGMVGFGGIGKLHTANWRKLNLYYPDLPVDISLRGAAARSSNSKRHAIELGGFT